MRKTCMSISWIFHLFLSSPLFAAEPQVVEASKKEGEVVWSRRCPFRKARSWRRCSKSEAGLDILEVADLFNKAFRLTH